MSRRADPHAGLLRHLQARLAQAGLRAELQSSQSQRWSSATFTGARHRFHFAASCGEEGIAEVARDLADGDLPLPDHIVADIALIHAQGTRFEVEALTVETH